MIPAPPATHSPQPTELTASRIAQAELYQHLGTLGLERIANEACKHFNEHVPQIESSSLHAMLIAMSDEHSLSFRIGWTTPDLDHIDELVIGESIKKPYKSSGGSKRRSQRRAKKAVRRAMLKRGITKRVDLVDLTRLLRRAQRTLKRFKEGERAREATQPTPSTREGL